MALNSKYSNTCANARADARAALFNNGYLRIYTGTQATDADTAVSSQTLLAELRFNATAFPSASAGVAAANAITSGSAVASGTATWYRALKSDGTTVIEDGSAGTSSANLVLNSVVISSGATVAVTAFTITEAKS
jgi:hypothetical protein